MKRLAWYVPALLALPCFIADASAQIADCDALAASPFDQSRPVSVPGVDYCQARCRKGGAGVPQGARGSA